MNFNQLQEEIYKTNSKEELEKYKYLTLDLIVKINDKLLSMPNLELNFNPQSNTSYSPSKEMTQGKVINVNKQNFLNQELRKSENNENFYHLNSGYHDFNNSPKSTVFHGYTNGEPNISYLTVKFNEHFNTESLKKIFGKDVSFYFNIQKSAGKKIKPHYVLKDNIPASFKGNIFNKNVSHGISKELKDLKVLMYKQKVHIHDSNISPDNGDYSSSKFIGPTNESPANFWSIVKFNGRSYITFHLILFESKISNTELDMNDIKIILSQPSITLNKFLNNEKIRPYLNKLFEFFNE